MFKITIEGPTLEGPVVFEYEYRRRRLLGLTGHVCNSWVASTSGAWLCPVCGRPATEISWVVQEVIDEPR